MCVSIVRCSKGTNFGREYLPRTGSLVLVAEDLQAVEAVEGGAGEEGVDELEDDPVTDDEQPTMANLKAA